ncbi:MAG: hypothetical protein ACRC7N_03940 [Clostridium sp.]
MSKRNRYFAVVAHCLINPSTRVHALGKRYELAETLCKLFLSKHISIIQLPCPEFTAMGYMRNPQGRQQYDNVFFRKHCKKALESYIDMIKELTDNGNTPLCFIGIQGSPTCCINWGKHKINKYKTESINEVEGDSTIGLNGIMTEVLKEMMQNVGINIPFLEAPTKENVESERYKSFFSDIYDLLNISKEFREL